MGDRRFPIMSGGALKSVPWSIVEPARAQLMRNHGQTVERLAQRGGLDPTELVGALNGLSWGQLDRLTMPNAMAWLAKRLEEDEQHG